MALRGSIELEGFDRFRSSMRQLESKIQKKVVRQALRAGAKIIHREAKQEAPELTGRTKRAVRVRAARRSRKFFGVNVQVGKQDFTGETFYAAFVELGTQHIQAMHWMKQAFERKKNEAKEAVLRTLGEGIAREARS